jgi:hypothetical protein
MTVEYLELISYDDRNFDTLIYFGLFNPPPAYEFENKKSLCVIS